MRISTKAAATLTAVTAALSLTALGGTASAATPAAKSTSVTCTAANTKVTVQQVDRPINHLLVAAKNTGTKTCNAYGAPYLRFDQGQSATPWLEASKPQSVVSLKPGQTAYAAIGNSSPEGSEGHQAEELEVHFSNSATNGSVGAPASPKLPEGGVYVDSSAYVTYWQTSAADALVW